MLCAVCYDVNTETRPAAAVYAASPKVCEATGQRVQKSVFECQIARPHRKSWNASCAPRSTRPKTRLRLYRLPDTRVPGFREFGRFKGRGLRGPAILSAPAPARTASARRHQ